MKVVIIGGGIAGLTLGIFLNKNNSEVVICERTWIPTNGHAFLMHSDAIAILNELKLAAEPEVKHKSINSYSLKRPKGTEIKHLKLSNWNCIKRVDLIKYLYDLFPKNSIKLGRDFSHFIYENEKVTAAVFKNGDVEYGDVFVGADGGNSIVREAIFGSIETTPVEVKEIVGVCKCTTIETNFLSNFNKFQHKTKGLAFGFIPTCEENEYVWFIQYDTAITDYNGNTAEELKLFSKHLLADFSQEAKAILDSNTFETSYIWKTRDFDLLPSFHKKNVVLIGDAAHQALPFTSAGTTNAILDAKVLAATLSENLTIEKAFTSFYETRKDDVLQHIQLGRDLKNEFINPSNKSDDDITVPLIKKREVGSIPGKSKPIQVLYFTDPICSTCWVIQPVLRKLELEYGDQINIKYCMGGLLPSWQEYNKPKKKKLISTVSEAAKHWDEVCAFYEMPGDGTIWNEDPMTSSYPPSIAFKAAQMQNADKAILFLRSIKEKVFLEKKNIIKWKHLENAAFDTGLDSARLLKDFEGKAPALFEEDLKLAQRLGITGFPTLIFYTSDFDNQHVIKGYQSYDAFEEIIKQLVPDIQKNIVETNPLHLFSRFSTMTTKELSIIYNITMEKAEMILDELYQKGAIDRYQNKNGNIWLSKEKQEY
jgi:2-polyprenyl-6-methoxyphenol hydroxylase-like FAD-dependent oxidoreductase/predicted DsbA family dithiol-disulfide isomerase